MQEALVHERKGGTGPMIDQEMKGKRVLVFGLARSGVGAANLLSSIGAEVTVTDRKGEGDIGEYRAMLDPSVRLHLGCYPECLNGAELIIVSPGVPLTIDPIVRARRQGIRIIGELELGFRFVERKVPFLAVTGTNGKSTTTTLLDLMLRKGGYSTILGGNIGTAITWELMKAAGVGHSGVSDDAAAFCFKPDADFIVAEVSSFQLESISEFRPMGAAIINITPDHMDRYRSVEEYEEAKAQVFSNQGERDFLVLNADDHGAMRVKQERLTGKAERPDVYYFSRRSEVRGIYVRDGWICLNLDGAKTGPISGRLIHTDHVRIKGVHNIENAMASAAMALLAGSGSMAVSETLREFTGLEHRMEFVREFNGVKYINDSKGTNVGAVAKSLEGIAEPVVLIAGGRDKAGDFVSLRPLVKERVKSAILIGEASERIDGAIGDLVKTVRVMNMTEAVHTARDMAQRGDAVLLSPACASFDMFRDFEDRGMQFKTIVMGLH
jgi:UDP-N-acetylmuramoylalanine--D-glutamate ligase